MKKIFLEFPLPDFPRLTHFGLCEDRLPQHNPVLHQHFGFEFHFVLSGSFDLFLHPNLPKMAMKAGDCLITAPDFPHQFKTSGGLFNYYWLGYQTSNQVAKAKRSEFRQPLLPQYQKELAYEMSYQEQTSSDLRLFEEALGQAKFMVLPKAWELKPLFEEIKLEILSHKKYAIQVIQLKLLELFTKCIRLLDDQVVPNSAKIAPKNITAKSFEKVLLFLETHLTEPLRLKDLAELMDWSEYHFSREFHKVMGTSPLAYVNEKRIEKAKELLLQDLSVKEVSERCGFKDPYYFSSFFKAKTKFSPTAFVNSKI